MFYSSMLFEISITAFDSYGCEFFKKHRRDPNMLMYLFCRSFRILVPHFLFTCNTLVRCIGGIEVHKHFNDIVKTLSHFNDQAQMIKIEGHIGKVTINTVSKNFFS